MYSATKSLCNEYFNSQLYSVLMEYGSSLYKGMMWEKMPEEGCIGVGMTCTLGGLIQYHVQFMCSIIACIIYDQANIGGAIAPPAPMVPTPGCRLMY